MGIRKVKLALTILFFQLISNVFQYQETGERVKKREGEEEEVREIEKMKSLLSILN